MIRKQNILTLIVFYLFIGCADKGKQPYQQVTGYPTEFLAKSWDKIKKWRDIILKKSKKSGKIFGLKINHLRQK